MKNDLIRFDWAIKRILRDKANYVVLEGLLTVILGRKIHIKNILESEGNQQTANDKFNRVDLLAEDDSGVLMLFEIQNDRELDYFHRMTYGVSKAITEYISLGQTYDKVRKVYSINIVYFDLGQGNDYVYVGKTDFHGLHNHDDILKLTASQRRAFHCDSPSDIFPEYYLLRVDEFDKVATTPLDEWISFLKTGEIPQSATAPGLAEARERLRLSQLPDDERRQYLRDLENLRYQRSVIETGRFEGRIEGHAEGRAEGLAEGLAEGRAAGLAEGRAAGLAEGRAEGHAEGRAEGHAEGLAEGHAEGRAEGLAEGRAEEKYNNARNLIANGVPLDVISKSLNISLSELNNL